MIYLHAMPRCNAKRRRYKRDSVSVCVCACIHFAVGKHQKTRATVRRLITRPYLSYLHRFVHTVSQSNVSRDANAYLFYIYRISPLLRTFWILHGDSGLFTCFESLKKAIIIGTIISWLRARRIYNEILLVSCVLS